MATVYVSYRSTERAFVTAVVSQLEMRHEICVDYRMPNAVDWRSYQLADLRRSDVFLVFVSEGTAESALQNSEIGGARFCSAYADGKFVLPALVDHVDPPPSIKDINYVDLTHRDAVRSAQQIDEAIGKLPKRVRLFISHSHRDQDIASRLVDVITSSLEVPPGELRCTSVPGYQLDLGAMAPDVLRRELGSAACVVAILTPNSVGAEWVLFELGAAWVMIKSAIPLLAGGLNDRDLPGPLRGASGGQFGSPITIDRLLDQLGRELRWQRRHDLPARQKQHDLVEYVRARRFPLYDELTASFAERRAQIGNNQGRVLDYIATKLQGRPYVPYDELSRQFARLETTLHFRLEQLRLLGFLERTRAGEADGLPLYGWTLSHEYRREIGV